MRQVIVRYRVKPGKGDENQRLVEAVFAELAKNKPAGIEYATFRLEDGVSFVHIARTESDAPPLPSLAAFQAFQAGLKDRCDEPPVVTEGNRIGAYSG